MAWLFYVPDTNRPDETRQRTILSRVVLFLIAGCLLLVLDTWRNVSVRQLFSGTWLEELSSIPGAIQLVFGSLFGLAGLLAIAWLNRQPLGRLGWLPGVSLLVTVTGMVSFADVPREVVDGRSLMLWVLPIALAPLILPSWTAFLAATSSTAAILFLSQSIAYELNWYSLLGLYVIAFVSWLSARALEQALQSERNEAEKNQVILENIADGVMVVDAAGCVQVANPAARNLLGDQLEHAARQRGRQIEYLGKIVEFSWTQIKGVGQAAVLRDITRQVEIERAKDAMLGTVSHELRTPLAAISGFADMIGLLSQNEKISEMAARITANAGRLKGLVNSLLDQAQIQAGTLKLNKGMVSPARLAMDIRDLMGGLAQEKELAFEVFVYPGTPETVQGDAERLHQVLVNLVGNAIKFTDRGKVTLQMYALPEKRWGFSVSDTGDGIPAARLPDIFEPFRRGADYATRPRQGAGLGLSISKQLVELMGGEIRVQSEAGHGSIFRVYLPNGSSS
jgi:signal transduction histidine kinase